jgi:glycosyltransferase involved in cell wall biosynthesis
MQRETQTSGCEFAAGGERRRLSVVHVAGQLKTGGLERLLVEFARHTDPTRFRLHFVSLGDRGTVADEIERAGWAVTTINQPKGIRPTMVWRLAHIFRRCEADVVHAHNLRPLIYCAPAAILAGAKLLHTRHGQQYGAGRRAAAQLRLAAGLAEGVVCVSAEGAALSRAQGVAGGKIRTIHNGIDVSRFTYMGPKGGGPAVMVGRLSPEKDVENLLRAMAIVVRQEPELRLEIAGDGRCMLPLRELTRSLGLEKCVRFLGEVRDVAEVLGRASMFVLPSKTEGISLTLLEAMSRGLPVIATRVGGTIEVIEAGKSGVMVAAQSPAELAEAMLRVYRDPTRAFEMGRAAHERVAADFDVRSMVKKYEKCYLRCAGGRLDLNARCA